MKTKISIAALSLILVFGCKKREEMPVAPAPDYSTTKLIERRDTSILFPHSIVNVQKYRYDSEGRILENNSSLHGTMLVQYQNGSYKGFTSLQGDMILISQEVKRNATGTITKVIMHSQEGTHTWDYFYNDQNTMTAIIKNSFGMLPGTDTALGPFNIENGVQAVEFQILKGFDTSRRYQQRLEYHFHSLYGLLREVSMVKEFKRSESGGSNNWELDTTRSYQTEYIPIPIPTGSTNFNKKQDLLFRTYYSNDPIIPISTVLPRIDDRLKRIMHNDKLLYEEEILKIEANQQGLITKLWKKCNTYGSGGEINSSIVRSSFHYTTY